MSYSDNYTPTAAASGAHRRRDQLGSMSRSASTSTLLNSPITTRSGRALGAIGGKTSGPGFSPYARRTARGAAGLAEQRIEEASATAANEHGHVHGGLVSMVKGLPGRALGFLFRSGSKQNIARSQSVADLASSESSLQATGAPRGRGLPSSASVVTSLAPPRQNIPRTSSLSALALPPPASRQPRSTHSTLVLNPPPPRPAFQSRSRNASPALSSLSYINRSPSPPRNTLATSMSAYNFNGPASPSFGPRSPSYGLTSRSPFAARSPALSSAGHALFPYGASLPRSTAGSVTGSGSKRPHYSEAGSPPRSDADFGRRGSPLNPGAGMGEERARKKMLVWDPKEGLISREQRERERERYVLRGLSGGSGTDDVGNRDAAPLPKNEAERILEVLEGMGRTPLGEAKRGAVRVRSFYSSRSHELTPKQINVPTPSTTSRLSHSISTPLSPYTRRANPRGGEAREGTGLSSVFRAREERRAKREQEDREEREERERERVEAEERRERRREIEREFDEEEERERREGREIEEDAPRRKTRSMVKEAAKGKGKALAPPPTSTRKAKGKGRAKRATEEEEDGRSARDLDMASPPSRSTRRSKSPAPPLPAAKAVSPPPLPVVPPKAAPALSSLRPGRSHNSRAHTTSAKVFSAREEDLPPVDESELGKIKLPPMVFPANFSFGPAATTVAKKVELAPSKEESNSLTSRLGPAAPTPAPAFSFDAPSAPAATTPSFSFASSAPTPKPAAPALASSTSFDFFSEPPTAPTPALFGSPSTTKPNFFGAVLAEKASAPSPPLAVAAPFSFGAPAVKPLEKVEKKEEEEKEVAANPFAAFGKPIAKIVEESGATLAPSPAPSFGGFGNGASGKMFGSKPVEGEVSRLRHGTV